MPGIGRRGEGKPLDPAQDWHNNGGVVEVARDAIPGGFELHCGSREGLARIAGKREQAGAGPARPGLTGQALIDAMQVSPCRDQELEPVCMLMPVRDVEL